MSRAAKERIGWVVALAAALITTLAPAAHASLPRSVDDPALRAAIAAEHSAAASAVPAYRLLARASTGYGLLPREPACVSPSTYPETRVRASGFLAEAQRQGTRQLSLDLAMGVYDGPSMYQFAGYDPVNNGDPLGLCIDQTTKMWIFPETPECEALRENLLSLEGMGRSARFAKGEVVGAGVLIRETVEFANDVQNNKLKLLMQGVEMAQALQYLATHHEEVLANLPEAARAEWEAYLAAPPEEQGQPFGKALLGMLATGATRTVEAGNALVKLRKVFRVDAPELPGRAPDVNKLNHIFGKAEHELGDFVRGQGGPEKAFQAIQAAANKALAEGKLVPGPNGVLPAGDAGYIIDVAGMPIRLVGGRVIDGTVRIGSASRKGLP